MLIATVDIVQWYCVVFEFIEVTATLDIVQCYFVVCGDFLFTATIYIVQYYCVVLEFIVVTATVDIVQCYCVVCGVYCRYSNSRYSAMLLCFVWRLFWLRQQ